MAHYRLRTLTLNSPLPPAKRLKPSSPLAAAFVDDGEDDSQDDLVTPHRLRFDSAAVDTDTSDDGILRQPGGAADFLLSTPLRARAKSPPSLPEEGQLLEPQVNPFNPAFEGAAAAAGASAMAIDTPTTPPRGASRPSPFRSATMSTGGSGRVADWTPQSPGISPLESPPRDGLPMTPATPAKLRGSVSRSGRAGASGAAAGSGFDSDEEKTQVSRFAEDFEDLGVVGTGAFGTVMKVRRRLDGCLYAVKRSRRRFHGVLHRAEMLKEVFALAALCAEAEVPHVVRYFSAWVEEDSLYIQTELCDCSLEDLVRHGFPQDMDALLLTARHVLLGLRQLHSHKMVHLDIKPANIFVRNNQFKIGDFGLATLADTRGTEVMEGDSRYLSRELLQEAATDLPMCDVFSLGATLYEMCLGRELPANGAEWNEIRNGCLQQLPHVSEEVMALIRQMMHPEPSFRPSAEALLRHPLLRSSEETELEQSRADAERSNAIAESYKNIAETYKHALVEKIQKDQAKLSRSYTM